jgi:site-specific DNA-cytosine methylase
VAQGLQCQKKGLQSFFSLSGFGGYSLLPSSKSRIKRRNIIIKNKEMKVLSLFDGISVAQQALKELGANVEVYYASEIDKYALQVTQKNFPGTIQLGDVCKLGKEVPYPQELLNGGCDLIIFGSPCTDLSIAKRNRQGLKGSQSGLFYEAVRILKDLKPVYWVMENVNSMSQESKAEITKVLTDAKI